MIDRRTFSLLTTGLLLAAASVFGQTVTLPNITLTSSTNLPPFGLASTETAQVNIVNTASTASNGNAAACTGSIAFYNASGTIIGTASPFTALGTGKIFSATLTYSATGGTGSRMVVRAEITGSTALTGMAITPCSLSSSLEIYDSATGVTHAFVSGTATLNPIGIGIVSPVLMNPAAGN